jgi:hypothetical protein
MTRFSLALLAVLLLGTGSLESCPEYVPPEDNSFTLAILPDTQTYSRHFPEVFTSQTQWIADNYIEEDIRYVLHVGDVTDRNYEWEWENAVDSMSLLDGLVPYTIVPGNHDSGGDDDRTIRDTVRLNEYFPLSYAGAYELGKIDNHYQYLTAGGIDWLILGLEFAPRNAVLAWANDVVSNHPEHRVIVLTHTNLFGDGIIQGGNPQHPKPKPGSWEDGAGLNTPIKMWNKFLKLHPNITLVFSGHVAGEAWSITYGDYGNMVIHMTANFQGQRAGGDGRLRLVTINPDRELILVETYAAWLGTFEDDRNSQFTIHGVDLGPPFVPPTWPDGWPL